MIPPLERIVLKCAIAVLAYFSVSGFFRELTGRKRRDET